MFVSHSPLYAKAFPEWKYQNGDKGNEQTTTEIDALWRILVNTRKELKNFWKIHLLTLSGSKNKCDAEAFARVFGLEFTLKEGMYGRKTSYLRWSCRWRQQSIGWIIVINIVIIYTSTTGCAQQIYLMTVNCTTRVEWAVNVVGIIRSLHFLRFCTHISWLLHSLVFCTLRSHLGCTRISVVS